MPVQKRPSLEIAAKLAETSKNLGGAYIYASLSKGILREENASAVIAKNEFAEFACADCGTEFQALAVTKPHCIVCGSLTRKNEDKKVVAKIHPDQDLVSVTCNACNTVNVTHEKILASVGEGNNPFCTSCGTELSLTVVKAEEEKEDKDEDESAAEGDDKADDKKDEEKSDLAPATVAADDEGKKDEDEKSGEVPPQFKKDDKEKSDAAPAATAKEDEKKEDKKPEEKSEVAPAATAADEKKDEKKDDAEKSDAIPAIVKPATSPDVPELLHDTHGDGSKSAAIQQADADEMPMEGEEEIEMMDMIDDDNIDEVALIARSGAIQLASGPYIVAELKEEAAGDNKEIFHSAQFQRAIMDSIRKDGLAKAVAAYKFAPVKVKANLKKHIDKVVAKRMETEAAVLEKAKNDLSKTFKQSLDIATVGLQKNFWAKKQNPLKAAFVAELATVGVRNPEKMVNRIFDQQGLPYNTLLIAQAEELMKKSVEMRNEISSVLDMTQTIVAGEDSDEEDNGEEGEVLSAAKPLSESDSKALKNQKRRETSGATKHSVLSNVLGEDANDLFNS